jgi:hypothetical protein
MALKRYFVLEIVVGGLLRSALSESTDAREIDVLLLSSDGGRFGSIGK